MSPNNGILFNGVLIPKLLNNHFLFSSFINLDFLLLVFSTFGSTFSAFCFTSNSMTTCFIMACV